MGEDSRYACATAAANFLQGPTHDGNEWTHLDHVLRFQNVQNQLGQLKGHPSILLLAPDAADRLQFLTHCDEAG